MRRVDRSGQPNHISTRGLRIFLLLDFPLGLEPMAERPTIE